jgi:hypothetical protein
MRIQSVELVSLPDAPTWQEKIYRAHLDTGEDYGSVPAALGCALAAGKP